MKHEKTWSRLGRVVGLALACLALGAVTTEGQFQGDVFFAEPSVVVGAGGTGEMEVLLFSGAEAVGAVAIDLDFDPGQLEITALGPGDSIELGAVFAVERDNGRVSWVSANHRSLDQPIGTVSLARLQVRPLAGAGAVVPLNLEVRELLETDGATLPGQGFAGEVVVSSPAAPRTARGKVGAESLSVAEAQSGRTAELTDAARLPLPEQSELRRRALQLGRPGQPLVLYRTEQVNGEVVAVPTRVQITVPSREQPSDG